MSVHHPRFGPCTSTLAPCVASTAKQDCSSHGGNAGFEGECSNPGVLICVVVDPQGH